MLLTWLSRLFRPRRDLRSIRSSPKRAVAETPLASPARSEVARSETTTSDTAATDADRSEVAPPDGALPARRERAAGSSAPHALDRAAHAHATLAGREAEILARIDEKIRSQRIDLPYLPSTSMAVIDLASRPTVEVMAVVEAISTDLVLSSELMKLANSAFYSGVEPVETLQQAVVRIGLRELRSFTFSASLKGVILREKGFAEFANAVWRQSYSVGSIARAIAPHVGMDPEKAFLLGLLHDIGKIPLLSMLKAEHAHDVEVNQALVGKTFHLYHEIAGRTVARAWRLPEEIVSVAGCHHHFQDNTEHPRSAAFASLAHKLDLYLSLDDDTDYRALAHSAEMDFLRLDDARRRAVLAAAEKAYVPPTEKPLANAA